MVHVGDLDGFADAQFARIGLLRARQHAEQRGLARAVRSDDADDAAARQVEAQILDEQFVPEALAEVQGLDHQITQAGAGRDEELLGFIALLLFL